MSRWSAPLGAMLGAALLAASCTMVRPGRSEDLTTVSCAPWPAVEAELRGRFAESPRAYGVASNGLVLVMYASAAGSWTAVALTPSGLGCVLSSGTGFEALPALPVAKGAPL